MEKGLNGVYRVGGCGVVDDTKYRKFKWGGNLIVFSPRTYPIYSFASWNCSSSLLAAATLLDEPGFNKSNSIIKIGWFFRALFDIRRIGWLFMYRNKFTLMPSVRSKVLRSMNGANIFEMKFRINKKRISTPPLPLLTTHLEVV